MNTVTYCGNVVDYDNWETEMCSNIGLWVFQRFNGVRPPGLRIFHEYVSQATDITPVDEEGLKRLETLTGHFYVVLFPQLPIAIVIAIIAGAISIGLSFLLRPSLKNQPSQSPNNSLSDRSNQQRLGQRIPDIVGTLRAIPDLIAPPYRIFQANQEVEHSDLCLGRGDYYIWDVKDDETSISTTSQEIAGESVAIYGPNTSANSGDSPKLLIGSPIDTPIVSTRACTSVNGQELRPINANNINGNNNIQFIGPDTLKTNNANRDQAIDFTTYFAVNDKLTVVDGTCNDTTTTGGTLSQNYSGTYTILAVSNDTIILANPGAVNPAWNNMGSIAYNGTPQATHYTSANLSVSGPKWVGPFVLNSNVQNEVWCNFVATNGMYMVDGDGNQHSLKVQLQVGVQAIDSNNNPVGAEIFYTTTVIGSAKERNQRAVTLKAILPFAGPCQVRAQRLTSRDLKTGDTIQDTVQWRDLYSVAPIGVINFGNVTTIKTVTYATASALTTSERKLNMLVTRLLPDYSQGVVGDLIPTNKAADIYCALAMDPKIGNRKITDLDIPGIYGAWTDAFNYFGTALCGEFCYTFDDQNTSFEEMVAQIAQSVFCTAYRQGSKLSWFFEKSTSDAIMLFNHRNKVPESETRTVSFGYLNDNDGIELEYIDPNAPNNANLDTPWTLRFPTDGSAVNPKQIKSVGIRNRVQATLLGWRYYNKLRYQNTATQFKSLEEAALIINNQRVLISDDTRADTQAGYILAVDGPGFRLSQPPKLDAGVYAITLQYPDGSIETIPIISVSEVNKVVLQRPPRSPLIVDPSYRIQTNYIITTGIVDTNPFLVTSKKPDTAWTYDLEAVNYDDRYYQNDGDVKAGLVIPDPAIYTSNGGYVGPAVTGNQGNGGAGYAAGSGGLNRPGYGDGVGVDYTLQTVV